MNLVGIFPIKYVEETNSMLNALWIVLLGMAMIFAILGILLLVMYLLGKIPQLRDKTEEGQ